MDFNILLYWKRTKIYNFKYIYNRTLAHNFEVKTINNHCLVNKPITSFYQHCQEGTGYSRFHLSAGLYSIPQLLGVKRCWALMLSTKRTG